MKIKSSMAFALVLLAATTVNARGKKTIGKVGLATNFINGTVVKCSFKGNNKGFLSSSSKSLECAIQDSGGELFNFSVPGSLQEKIMSAAGKNVVLEISTARSTKIKDAKTNNTVIAVYPSDQSDLEEEVICGPEDPENINTKKKPYSQGFRVARPVSIDLENEMQMLAYVGTIDDDKWMSKNDNSVFLGGQCNSSAAAKKLMFVDGSVIFDYVQYKKNGSYFVERAAVLN